MPSNVQVSPALKTIGHNRRIRRAWDSRRVTSQQWGIPDDVVVAESGSLGAGPTSDSKEHSVSGAKLNSNAKSYNNGGRILRPFSR